MKLIHQDTPPRKISGSPARKVPLQPDRGEIGTALNQLDAAQQTRRINHVRYARTASDPGVQTSQSWGFATTT